MNKLLLLIPPVALATYAVLVRNKSKYIQRLKHFEQQEDQWAVKEQKYAEQIARLLLGSIEKELDDPIEELVANYQPREIPTKYKAKQSLDAVIEQRG